jgi:hypothetical protein
MDWAPTSAELLSVNPGNAEISGTLPLVEILDASVREI